MKTAIATFLIIVGCLLPSTASALRYDRINKSLPGLCMTKHAKALKKLCRDVGPALGHH